ncbi:MAG TPA: helix-turn-helix domain-containing protein [Acidothermaceae bacterium]
MSTGPVVEDQAVLDVEDRFAIVPVWVLDAAISDAAVRLYAVLLRFGQTSGARMPARSTLARRMHKKSADTVDRAMRELVELGAVVVQHRFDGGQRLTNKYLVRTSRPRDHGSGGGRTDAATGSGAATRMREGEGGRIVAATVAAPVRHDPEFFTESSTPPPPTPAPDAAVSRSWAEEADRLITECGIDDWDGFVNQCQVLRRQLGQPTGRWSKHCLLAAIQLAVRARDWPAAQTKTALPSVAADPNTRSPMRLAEAGPWWDEPVATTAVSDVAAADLAAMEADLADAGGLRPLLQRQAREQLAADGVPTTRATVTMRAHALLNQRLDNEAGAAAC